MDDQGSESASTGGVEVVVEGWMLKLNRNKHWQDRYVVFTSDQILSYYHKKGEAKLGPSYRISKYAGCEISDLYVEQRQTTSGKEALYCFSLSWPDDTTVSSVGRDLFRDDTSLLGAESSPQRSPSRVNNASTGEPEYEENSVISFGKPRNYRRPRSWLRGGLHGRGRSTRSLPNIELDSVSLKQKEGDHRFHSGVPSFVNIGHQAESPAKGSESQGEMPDISSPSMDVLQRPPQSSARGTPDKRHVRRSNSELEYKGDRGKTKGGQVTYNKQQTAEREKLLGEYFENKREKKKKYRERIVESTKYYAAATAAVGVGVVTAGVGLAAGLVVLGATAGVAGTAGVAEATFKGRQKGGKLTIATTNYEKAKLFFSSLQACLEVESMKQSTWCQLFLAEGRKTTSALMPNNVELRQVPSTDSDDSSPFGDKTNFLELPKGQPNLFLKDRDFLVEAGTKWCPLEAGWVSFLGPGAQSLRIFREEKLSIHDNSKKTSGLAIGGLTCTPLKTQVVLNALPLDAFMCLMSYARISQSESRDVLSPNSGQSASFRLIERIDDHTDVIHIICRKLYLFPSWTAPRDFVLFRYWRYDPYRGYIICYDSVQHPMCPPLPGFVRGEMHQVCTIAPPKNFEQRRKGNTFTSSVPECLLTSVVQVDPKGWVPTKPIPFLANQTYADAFGVAALLQIMDIRDAILNDRFLDVAPEFQHRSTPVGKTRRRSRSGPQERDGSDQISYDLRFANRERCDSITFDTLSGLETLPPPLFYDKWAEPDANSFVVRGPSYKEDRIKINAGASIGRLVAVDVVRVEKPIYSGMSMHPNERIQRALRREKMLKESGKESDMPPFIFVVNIVLPGPPVYHGVFYYAVDDMSTIDGSDGTGSSRLCKEFLFGDSDSFRDRTFKLIPQIVQGNFMVRKAVGSTPAIMGTKLKQCYVRRDRFMEVILDCGSSPVASGVIRLSLGYAKSLVIDMGFLLEGDTRDYLPERIFGCVRMKYPEFGPSLRKVDEYTT